jgi:hypothetical protein
MRFTYALFACSKHQSHPLTPPAPDSTDANVYLDPGNVNALILTDSFRSFNLIHAYDSGGLVYITARAVVKNDTCSLAISFADTLRPNTPYANYTSRDSVYIDHDTIGITKGADNFSLSYFNPFLGITYLSGVNKDFTGDTLLITTFDKSNHLLTGTFKATMTASASESPAITQTSTYVTGTFNTYFNTPPK